MPARNTLPTLSMMFGVLSLVFIMMGFSIPVGALGIVVGLLSRGRGELEGRAKIGIALSLFAIAAGICVLIWSAKVLSTLDLDQLLEQYNALYGA